MTNSNSFEINQTLTVRVWCMLSETTEGWMIRAKFENLWDILLLKLLEIYFIFNLWLSVVIYLKIKTWKFTPRWNYRELLLLLSYKAKKSRNELKWSCRQRLNESIAYQINPKHFTDRNLAIRKVSIIHNNCNSVAKCKIFL